MITSGDALAVECKISIMGDGGPSRIKVVKGTPYVVKGCTRKATGASCNVADCINYIIGKCAEGMGDPEGVLKKDAATVAMIGKCHEIRGRNPNAESLDAFVVSNAGTGCGILEIRESKLCCRSLI